MMNYIKTLILLLVLTFSGRSQAENVLSISSEEPLKTFYQDETPGDYKEWKDWEEVIGGTEGWKLVRKKKGITIYLRRVNVTPVKHFRAFMELDIDLSTLVAFMTDVDAYPDYLRLCNASKVLHTVNDRVSYIHTINQLPWPVSVRDSIGYTCWSQDPETLVVKSNIVGFADYIPPVKGYVRVPFLLMQFVLTPQKNGKILLKFEGTAEPGGWIPNWVANFVVVDTPWTTFSKVQKGMHFEKYKNKKTSWLKEPPIVTR
jgi:hypothetical protein